MARSLVIVESPAKAKTINKYLGRNYSVKASVGHIMDLPKKDIGIVLPEEPKRARKGKKSAKNGKAAKPVPAPQPVDPEKLFNPTDVVIPGKQKVVNDLRKHAAGADTVYLAADPDREGEAICAHLETVLTAPSNLLWSGYENGNGRRGRWKKNARAAEAVEE